MAVGSIVLLYGWLYLFNNVSACFDISDISKLISNLNLNVRGVWYYFFFLSYLSDWFLFNHRYLVSYRILIGFIIKALKIYTPYAYRRISILSSLLFSSLLFETILKKPPCSGPGRNSKIWDRVWHCKNWEMRMARCVAYTTWRKWDGWWKECVCVMPSDKGGGVNWFV